jgi:hypothetical protein
MPDDSLRGVPADPLRTVVPVGDLSTGIDEIHAVGEVVDDGLVELVVELVDGHGGGSGGRA